MMTKTVDKPGTSSHAAQSAGSRFSLSDQKLLVNGLFSDVEVRCGNRSWKLHKVILCNRCVWFNKALDGRFKEGISGVVEINEFEPEKIEWLLNYLYTGTLEPWGAEHQKSFSTYIDLYLIGDYFHVPELCEDALSNLRGKLSESVSILQQAKQQNTNATFYGPKRSQSPRIDNLINQSDALCKAFYEAVYSVYSHDDLGSGTKLLRDCLIEFFAKTALYHLDRGSKFMDILRETPGFLIDCLTNSGGFGVDLRYVTYPKECSHCGRNPFANSESFEKIQVEGEESLHLAAYCQRCAANQK